MELSHTLTLKQAEIAAELFDGAQSEKHFHRGGTSGITIFNDVDGLEESKTQSRGPGTSADGNVRQGSEESKTVTRMR